MNKGTEEEAERVLETEQVIIKDEAIESFYLSEIKSEPEDNFDYESNGDCETYESICVEPLTAFKSENEDSDESTNDDQIRENQVFHPQENVHEIGYPTPCSSKNEFGDASSIPNNYCHECKKEFRRHSALVSHLKMHILDDDDDDYADAAGGGGDDKQFECDICNKKTQTKNGLEKHRGTHFRRTYECEVCDFKTYDFREKCLHQKKHLKSDRLYKCSLCNYQTTCENAKNEHLKIHELSGHKRLCVNKKQDILYQCRVCNYQTRDINAKNDHLKEHSLADKEPVAHKATDTIYKSCKCNYRTKNESDKALHEETVHKTKMVNTVLSCGVCFKTFSELEHFVAHKKNNSELECKECGQLLSKKSHMLFHRLSHVGEFSNICCACGSEFSMRTILKVHESMHKEKINCKCDVCGREFVLPSQMFAHKRIHHMGRNVYDEAADVKLHYAKEGYLCKQCGIKYEDILEYTKHMLVHWKSAEYMSKCSICNNVFKSAAELVNHRKTHPQMMTS